MTHLLDNKKILYFIADDEFFCGHLFDLALAAQKEGADVGVITRVSRHGDTIQKAGIKLIPLHTLHRSKINFFNEGCVFKQLLSVFLKEKPAVVHNIGMKPILYGSLMASLAGIPKIVNSFTGLGFMFTHDTPNTRLKRKIFTTLFKLLAKNKSMVSIVQNKDDFKIFQTLKLTPPSRLFLIRGCGVDPQVFKATPEPETASGVRVAFVARMLKDKGVVELIEAIRILKEKGVSAHFLFYGTVDPQNPSSLSKEDLNAWHREGLIDWQGHCEHMAEAYKNVHMVVLPSYREGLPKSLLEAASCGRVIVATDVPGCREIVEHGVNGFLVPPQDPVALANALEKLINDSALRKSMGQAGRKMVEDHFSLEKVNAETMKCY
ncbi:MAG: glycosyltransferase family 4 protein [Proteobacteria bacterium]|nr:glycosyltransferase family 4 protein [Pseudomonadota bacterium]